MCRAIDHGGRRCPSCEPEFRAAYRKASRAATVGAPIGDGGATLELPTGAPSLDKEWQPERVVALAEDIGVATKPLEMGSDPEEGDRLYHAYRASKDRVEEMGGPEGAVRVLGSAIASEAERRAGVTGEQVRQMCLDSAAKAEREAEALRAQMAEIDRQIKALPESKALDEASAAYREAFDDPSADIDTKNQLLEAREAARGPWRTASSELRMRKADINERANKLSNAAATSLPQEARDGMLALSHAYQEVLGETRTLGGTTPEWSPDSTTQGVKAFNEVMPLFPKDWIDAHNDGGQVTVRIGKKRKDGRYERAHYSEGVEKDIRKRVRDSMVVHGNPSRGRPKDDPWTSYRELTEQEIKENHIYVSAGVYMREEWETKFDYETQLDENTPPRGRGWERYEDESHQAWRRPLMKTKLLGTEMSTEASTAPKGKVIDRDSETARTATHEFSHRCEARVPQIGQLEARFIQRRTTDPEGNQEELVTLAPATAKEPEEVARADGFASAYMGREYDGWRHHEVLSTGTEALFHGSYGGLVGGSRYSPDPDMRAFVLGVMASVGRR